MTRRDVFNHSARAVGTLMLCKSAVFRTANAEIDRQAIEKLRIKFRGRLLLPSDPTYDIARTVFEMNPENDKHPAVIAQCTNEDDILRCIDFAHRQHLEVAVRSGNHSILGWGTCDKGIVIDLSRMKGIDVDPVKQTARVRAGSTAEEILATAAVHRLAPVLGQCGTVGAGLALGGGLGWLSGMYGATSDNVLGARLITADGRTLKTSAHAREDLFWAIRGGGGSFGVVTLLEYQLRPVGEVLAGNLVYPINKAKAVLRYFREFMASAPDELQADLYLKAHDGGRVSMQCVYAGDLDHGERVVDTFRKFDAPDHDSVKRRRFAEIYKMNEDDTSNSCPFEYMKGCYVETLSDEVIETILETFAQRPVSCDVVFDLSHYMHGQVCRIAPGATPFDLRKAGAVHLGFWVQWKEQAQASACMAWSKKTYERLQRYSGGRIYSNYMSTTGEAAVKRVYGSNYPRLAQLKAKYDPQNFFHLNQNVRPK